MENLPVIYHNDLNKIKVPNFNELQQNILFGIIAKIRNNDDKRRFIFTPQELNKFVENRNFTQRELFDEVCLLKDNFFKADFTILQKEQIDENRSLVNKRVVNLFREFSIWYEVDKNEKFVKFDRLELEIDEMFAYLIKDATKQFTRFEIAEFINISGKYAKTLYRLLKQFRTTGWAQFEWEEFKELLGIPKDYLAGNIDQRILKPVIKELKRERNLFDLQRIPFEDLSYEKIKNKNGRGRGGKVVGIKFTFKPQSQAELDALENLELERLQQENKELKQHINSVEHKHKLREVQQARIAKFKQNQAESQKSKEAKEALSELGIGICDELQTYANYGRRIRLNGEFVQVRDIIKNADESVDIFHDKSENSRDGIADKPLHCDNENHALNTIKKLLV